MRIGIVTQPLNDNYGGILQNWALHQVLHEMGHNPITLDVYLKYPKWRYILSYFLTSLLNFGGAKRNYPVKPINGRIASKFTADFISTINLTKPLNKYSTRVIKNNKIDALIVGSDQVWRPKYNPNIYDMYLDFAKNIRCTKIAYAASFGVDEWEYSEEERDKCQELIKQFNAVSVREESGVNLCKKHLNIDADIVLDPTLLLKKDKYADICSNIPRAKESFIAVYCLDLKDEVMRIIERQYGGKKIIVFSAHGNNTLTVPQWLSMFRDAEEVITDSFHGTVFSIIFNKQFINIPNESRGSSRLETLYNLIGIHRDTHKLNLSPQPIDYFLVNATIDKLAQLSKTFLINNLYKS